MSWLHELYETYEANKSILGKVELNRWNKEVQLLPIAHAFQNAQIEVRVTDKGEFHSAEVIEKEKAPTLIPVTIESAGRTSKPSPHPLHDSLQYVAGDYEDYGGSYKSESSYEMYINNLELWCLEGNAPQEIKSIYEYLKKGCLISDLLDDGVLHAENNILISKWTKEMGEKPEVFKVLAGDQFSTFVRFTVRGSESTWENQKIVNNYINFLESKLSNNALDYVTGNLLPKTESHPSKIRYGGDMAKLISGNDSANFTYRGRFTDKEQVATVSYEVSQKAHNALKWLIDKQGRIIDGRVFLAWGRNPTTIPVPTPDESSVDILINDDDEDKTNIIDTRKIFAERFNKSLSGYRENLKEVENITIMILDAATPGRMGILHYQNLHPDLYLERIEEWHKKCWWQHRNKNKTWYGAPRLKDIAEATYGENANPNVIKNTITSLYPCVLQGQEISQTVVQAIFNRTRQPESFDENWKWNNQLNIACAVMNHKFKYHQQGSESEMKDIDETKERSFLFGRMLAVVDVLENNVLKNILKETRATNAMRYMNAFSMRPKSTWQTIYLAFDPYQKRLKNKGMNDGLTEISKIAGMLYEIDGFTDKPLDGQFLLGYYTQRNKMFTSTKNESDNGGENNDSTSE